VKGLRLIRIRLTVSSFAKTSLAGQDNSPAARIADSSSNERGQCCIRPHNQTLSVAVICVSNEGCSVWILPQLVAPERI